MFRAVSEPCRYLAASFPGVGLKKWLRHGLGILFDAACLCGGGFAAFLAFWTMHEGTTGEFWAVRVTLMVFIAPLIALMSSILFEDAPWRCWLRFLLFEGVSLVFIVTLLEHGWGRWSMDWHEGTIHLALAVLVDAALYAVGLSVWWLYRRVARPARGRPVTTACPGPR